MDTLLSSGGTLDSVCVSVDTQLQNSLKKYLSATQHVQVTQSGITPICLETDVTSFGGRLDIPLFCPQEILELKTHMEGVRSSLPESDRVETGLAPSTSE